jgi:hypothetical protein
MKQPVRLLLLLVVVVVVVAAAAEEVLWCCGSAGSTRGPVTRCTILRRACGMAATVRYALLPLDRFSCLCLAQGSWWKDLFLIFTAAITTSTGFKQQTYWAIAAPHQGNSLQRHLLTEPLLLLLLLLLMLMLLLRRCVAR